MKYNFQLEVPLHQKEKVTDELLKEECLRSISQAIEPLIKWGQLESTLVDDDLHMLETPKFKSEASLYAYNSDHMEHIIKMLQSIKNFSNPGMEDRISEVIAELTEK